MDEREFFFSSFGLLLGLTVVEVGTKLADAIGVRRRIPLGTLTPMLAMFGLLAAPLLRRRASGRYLPLSLIPHAFPAGGAWRRGGLE